MALIDQNVSEKEKTKDWIIGIGRHILQSSEGNSWDWEKDQLCWNMYNGRFEESDFDYLRKVGEYEYPAKVRFFPVIRPYIDNLISQHTLQPFNFLVYAFDNKSVESKINKRNAMYLDGIMASLFDHRGQLQNAEQKAREILQQIEQQMNPEQQAQAQTQGIQPVGPAPQIQIAQQAKTQFETQLEILNKKFQFTETQLQDIETKYKMNDREMHEILAQKALEYLQFNLKLERVFNNGFLAKNVTDKAIYYVDWDGKKPDPEVRKVNEKYFYYSYDNAIDFVHEAEWCEEDEYTSVANIIDQYRFELDADTLEYLNNKRASIGFANEAERNRSYSQNNPNNSSILTPMDAASSTCRVSRIFFKSPRKVYWKKTPNKYLPGTPRHLLIDESDIPSNDKLKKEEEILTYYINDIYEVVFVDGQFPIRARKKPIQNRGLDEYGIVNLPYSGIAWRSMNREASSPVYRTKDIQILYNIVHYHKELWLALSGAKGLIMDLSQKPEGMSMKEWMYQRKMGTGWIETMRKSGRNPSFNQFKTYDDSLGQGYQLLLNTLDHLERLCGKIIGIPPQRLGEIAQDDQVGTSKIAINQSTLTTEVLFKEHDVVKGLVYEKLVNDVRLAWKEGRRGSYILGGQQELLDIPSQILAGQQYRLFIKSSSKDFNSIQSLQRAAEGATAQGKLPMSNLAALYRMDNLTEVEKTLQQFEEKAQKIQQQMIEAEANAKGQNAQQQMQMELAFKKQLMELEQQFEGKYKEGELQIKQMSAQIQADALKWTQQKDMMDAQAVAAGLQIKTEEANQKAMNEQAKIESTRMVEGAYLSEEQRQFNITHGLNVKMHEDEMQIEKAEVGIKDGSAKAKALTDNQVAHRKADVHEVNETRKSLTDNNIKQEKGRQEFGQKQEKHTLDTRHQKEKADLSYDQQVEKHEVDLETKEKKANQDMHIKDMKAKLNMSLKRRAGSNRSVKNEP